MESQIHWTQGQHEAEHYARILKEIAGHFGRPRVEITMRDGKGFPGRILEIRAGNNAANRQPGSPADSFYGACLVEDGQGNALWLDFQDIKGAWSAEQGLHPQEVA